MAVEPTTIGGSARAQRLSSRFVHDKGMQVCGRTRQSLLWRQVGDASVVIKLLTCRHLVVNVKCGDGRVGGHGSGVDTAKFLKS